MSPDTAMETVPRFKQKKKKQREGFVWKLREWDCLLAKLGKCASVEKSEEETDWRENCLSQGLRAECEGLLEAGWWHRYERTAFIHPLLHQTGCEPL